MNKIRWHVPTVALCLSIVGFIVQSCVSNMTSNETAMCSFVKWDVEADNLRVMVRCEGVTQNIVPASEAKLLKRYIDEGLEKPQKLRLKREYLSIFVELAKAETSE